MLPCQAINITIEIITLALLAALAIVMVLRGRSTGMDKLLFATVIVHAVNTTGDLLAWVFTSYSNQLSVMLANVGNVVTYFFGPLAYTGLALLVCWWALGRKLFSKTASCAFVVAILIIGVASAALTFVNIPTGMLYTIDANNNFTWGSWSTLPDNLALAQFALALPALLIGGKGHTRRSLCAWVLYLGIPCVAVIQENTFNTLMLLYPTVALSLLLAYLEFQHFQEQRLMRRNLELRESQAKALSGQITSHFVFNALQSVRELCISDPKRAQQAIDDFSDYLRGNLQVANAGGMVSLDQEIEHVKAYLAVERIDPSSEFSVKWDLLTTNFKLPALTVQPLVENAVRHGVAGIDGGVIKVSSWEDSLAWHVAVRDNGRGFSNSVDGTAHVGIALDNVRSRLALLCSGTLDVTSSQDGTIVTITIPKKRYEAGA